MTLQANVTTYAYHMHLCKSTCYECGMFLMEHSRKCLAKDCPHVFLLMTPIVATYLMRTYSFFTMVDD